RWRRAARPMATPSSPHSRTPSTTSGVSRKPKNPLNRPSSGARLQGRLAPADNHRMQDELRLRTRMIGAGIHLSVVAVLGCAVWIALTWHEPHRGGLVAMVGSAALTTAIIAVIPRARIIHSRHRELFFMAWNLSLMAFVNV